MADGSGAMAFSRGENMEALSTEELVSAGLETY
jgi:hypothetical protein